MAGTFTLWELADSVNQNFCIREPVVIPLGHALPDSIKHTEDMYRDQDLRQQGSALVLQEIAW